MPRMERKQKRVDHIEKRKMLVKTMKFAIAKENKTNSVDEFCRNNDVFVGKLETPKKYLKTAMKILNLNKLGSFPQINLRFWKAFRFFMLSNFREIQ